MNSVDKAERYGSVYCFTGKSNNVGANYFTRGLATINSRLLFDTGRKSEIIKDRCCVTSR